MGQNRAWQWFGLVLCLVLAALSLLTFVLSGFQVSPLVSTLIFLSFVFLLRRRLQQP